MRKHDKTNYLGSIIYLIACIYMLNIYSANTISFYKSSLRLKTNDWLKQKNIAVVKKHPVYINYEII